MKSGLLIISFLILFSRTGLSQTDSLPGNKTDKDTVILEAEEIPSYLPLTKKPGRAALYSAVIPGAGQAYNGKFWKIPLVYSALGSAAFFFQYNNTRYKKYLLGYQQRIDTTLEETIFSEDLDTDVILQLKNNSRRNRDLSAVVILVVYTLNIIDATVDAELSNFDVSDDLSVRIAPEIIPLYGTKRTNTVGFNLCFNFK